MLARAALILSVAAAAAAACNKTEGGDVGPPPGSSGSAKPAKGGFSDDLAADLASDPTAKPARSAGSAAVPPAAGSAASAAGSAAPAAGSAVAIADPKPMAAKPGADDSKPAADDPKPVAPDPKAAGGAKPAPATPDPRLAVPDAKAAGGAKPAPATPDPKALAATADPKADPKADAPAVAPPPKVVKMTPELAAIKLSLLPNWDRDVDQPATFQYVVRIKGTQTTKTFTFHYGYDDAKAPADREAYKKYLQDTRQMTGEIKDRQRGGAWFLEGADASGAPAFRYVVLYGGKRLICYGSLYKDPDSSRLGDDRDQTIIQAKQICETLAL